MPCLLRVCVFVINIRVHSCGSIEIDNIIVYILYIFPKIFSGLDFLSDKDYHKIIDTVHVHGKPCHVDVCICFV